VTLCAASQGALDAVQCNDNYVCGPLSAQQVYANAGAGTSSDGSVLFDGARRSRSHARGRASAHALLAGSRRSRSSGRNCAPAQTRLDRAGHGKPVRLADQQKDLAVRKDACGGLTLDFWRGRAHKITVQPSRCRALRACLPAEAPRARACRAAGGRVRASGRRAAAAVGRGDRADGLLPPVQLLHGGLAGAAVVRAAPPRSRAPWAPRPHSREPLGSPPAQPHLHRVSQEQR